MGQTVKEKRREQFSHDAEAITEAPKPLFKLKLKKDDIHPI